LRKFCRFGDLAVPSKGVQPTTRFLLAIPLVIVLTLPAALASPPGASAGPLGTSIPGNCVEHTPYDGSADAPGDYRCAGIALDYHLGGSEHSPYPIWAGQWLFTDESGRYRVGSCTDNTGIHPVVTVPSQPRTQSLPNDPSGALSAYVAWRYGDTTDPLTAAAVWAVMHFYAQDRAGGHRADDPQVPLVPTLDSVAAASGRADVQQRAIEIAAEARRLADPWVLTVSVAPDGAAVVSLLAGTTAVPGRQVSLLVSGSDLPLTATTGTDGTATVTVPLPPSGIVTVAAAAEAPGPAVVYRGTAVVPDRRAQTLITGGESSRLTAQAQAEVLPTTPPATPPAPTTAAPTTLPVTVPPVTDAPATTSAGPGTDPAATSEPVPTTSGVVSMPVTGAGGDGVVAYLATASLVGGVGLVGTLRRRGATRPPATP
jgi:hypothetical protein